MMGDLFRTTAESLSDAMRHRWHAMMLGGRRDLGNIGAYCAHDDPMQIVSGAVHAPKVHYEAPPSRAVASEMGIFIKSSPPVSEKASFIAMRSNIFI